MLRPVLRVFAKQAHARAVSSTAPMLRESGTVKWFNITKGFGFILPDSAEDDQSDVFVHYSDIVGGEFFKLDSAPFPLAARSAC